MLVSRLLNAACVLVWGCNGVPLTDGMVMALSCEEFGRYLGRRVFGRA